VRAVDWERRGSEGGAPRNRRRAAASAKSRWLMGPRCLGELRDCQLGMAVCGFGGWGREEKGGGVDVGASASRREKEERGALA
jgi:hypothetical protein